MNEFLVAVPIALMPQGMTYLPGEPLPLHCTLLHWFSTDHRLARVERAVADLVQPQEEPIVLISEQPALFGPNDNVPVHVLKRNDALNLLHTRLLLLLSGWTQMKELRWVGAGYRAHVADANYESFTPGKSHAVDHLALVERVDDKKIVRSLHWFKLIKG